MAFYTHVFLILLTSPLLMLLVQMLLGRLLPKDVPRQFVALLCVAVAGGMVLVAIARLSVLHGRGPAGILWPYCVIVYACLGYSYFHAFNMSETARRIRILYEILKAGSIEVRILDSRYGPQEMLDIRISRLIETGQIRQQGQRLVIRGRLLYVAARLLNLWHSLLAKR